MAGNSLSLVWDLIARDGASPVFERVSASADKAAASTEAASAKVSGGFSTAAKAGVAAGVVFAAASIKMAADFQSSTVRLVTSANESQKNLKMVQQGMLDLAGKVGYSTDELSKAMYKVESGGQHGAAGLAVLKAAAQGAKTENADLTTVADALTSAMTDYHLKASDAATVTSKLVAATASGKMTFEELSGSLAAILPVASANHVALNDILGDLASMTMHGMSAEQASQNLADAIRHLAAPTQQQQKQFAALGLTAQDITADLGTKGLSGTINVIGDAIKANMGPGTSQVVLDLNTALSKLPAPVKELGQKILDGTLSLGEYRQAMKALPAEQAIAAQSFMGLVSSTHQIGNETKNGAQIYQSYSGALRQAMGDATGMNVALMIGGENAGNTAKAIGNVTKATADASGNVKGWDDIQKTFNQQLSEFGHSIEAAATGFGMHLLPALTSTMGFINRDVIPGFKTAGSAVGDAAHWFSELPAPIKDVGLALAGLGLAKAIGLTGALASAATTVTAPLRSVAAAMAEAEPHAGRFNDEMAIQQKLFQMEQREAALAADGISVLDGAFAGAAAAADTYAASLSRVQRMQMGWDATLGESAVLQDAQVASLGRMAGASAAASVTMGRATAGIGGALKSAGSGILAMFGGPWIAGLVAAGAAVWGINKAFEAQKQRVEDATKSILSWKKAQDLGGQGAVDASVKLAAYQKKIDDAQVAFDKVRKASEGAQAGTEGYAQGVAIAGGNLDDLKRALSRAQDQMSTYRASLTPTQTAQIAVTQAQNDFNDALKHNAPDSMAVAGAAGKLHDAQRDLAIVTERTNDAEKTQSQRMQEQALAALASLDATRGLQLSQLDLADAIDKYNTDAKSGQVSTRDLQREQLQLVDTAEQVAKKASDAAVAQAQQNGATDTGVLSQATFKQSLQETADKLSGPARKAVLDMINQMGGLATGGDIVTAHFQSMGANVVQAWQGAAVEVSGSTAAQIKNMQDLGYQVLHLPNGHIIVSADTNPAQDEINAMLIAYRAQTIILRSQMGDPGGTSRRMGAPATGGWISGPGTGTSDTAGVFRLSHGEFVVNAAAAKQNASLLTSINGGANVHTSGVPVLPGYAAGGFIGQPPMTVGRETVTVHMDPGSLAAQLADMLAPFKAAAAAAAPGAPTNVQGNAGIVQRMAAARGWTGSEWNALYSLVMRESGFRNTAQNPTSTAYGMFQFLNSTWGAYGGGKTSDPTAQTRMGLDYIAGRFHDPLGAWAHETKFGWYKNGTNFVPSDQLAMLHRGEAVVPASKNQGAPYKDGHTTVVGVQNLGPVTYSDTERIAATSFRHAAMAAARFQ